MNPLISVVVTTYNQAAYIEETLKSVLAQTYKPFEVIVVDDGSTDDTEARIASFGEQVIYIRQKNQGVAGSRNTGISNARGEYLAFLDGDDLWEPDKLSVQVDVAMRYPDSGLIAVDGSEFSGNETISKSIFFETWCKEHPENSIISGNYYYQIMKCNFISTTSQVMIPAKIFRMVGTSDMRFKRASDYDLYIRIASKFDITIVKKSLIRWRYLPSSVSGPRIQRGFRYLPEEINILKNHLRFCCDDDRSIIREIIKSKLLRGAEKLYYYGLESDRILATRCLLKLLVGNPALPIALPYLAGLWCPVAITGKFGKTVRKAIFNYGS